MPLHHRLPLCLVALTGTFLVGCYSPYRYSPYSPYAPYGGGVPTYSPQAVPQFGPPAGSPTLVAPEGGGFPPSGGSTFGPNDNLQPTPDPNNTFPPSGSGDGFNPTPSNGFDSTNGFNSSPSPNGNGLVPYPENPPPSNNGNTFEGNTTPFSSDGASFQSDPPNSNSVGLRGDSGHAARELQLAAHQSSPLETTPAAFRSNSNSVPGHGMYGYEPSNYRWLRGLVDFDEHERVWVMIYDDTPDASDAYRGQITLINNGLLSRLQNNDRVVVEGRIDPSTRDADTGKPQYRVEVLHGPLPAT